METNIPQTISGNNAEEQKEGVKPAVNEQAPQKRVRKRIKYTRALAAVTNVIGTIYPTKQIPFR